MARLLLDKGAEVDWRALEDGETPLSHARTAAANSRLLLDKGAEVTPGDGTARRCSRVRKNHVDAARLLLDNGAEVNRADERRSTPLYIACSTADVDAARLLLDNGAEVDRARKDGDAAVRRLPERPRRRGAAAGQRRKGRSGDGGRSDAAVHRLPDRATRPSSAAAGQRRGGRSADETVYAYVHRKEGPRSTRPSSERRGGRLAGTRTVKRRCSSPARTTGDAARLLLDGGAEVDRAERGRSDAAVRRLRKGHVDAARLLLEKGAEVDRATEGLGYTPLFVACEKGHVGAARCCWTKARRSIGRRGGRSDATVHREEKRPLVHRRAPRGASGSDHLRRQTPVASEGCLNVLTMCYRSGSLKIERGRTMH